MMNPAADDRPLALVTGASSGIGTASARSLARRGFRVVLAARSADRLAALGDEMARTGGAADWIAVDLADSAQTRHLLDCVSERYGRLDVLVNNAGYSPAAALEQLTRADVRDTFEVNLFSGLELIGHGVPMMRRSGGGRIINMGSLAARIPAPLAVPYAATKGALEAAARCLRLELRRWGIDVVLIVPGFVNTPAFDKARAWGGTLAERRGQPLPPADVRPG
jgi:NAD(P)-dependent dehydrogenase (short-subunit alcohol dehydrogenase family)